MADDTDTAAFVQSLKNDNTVRKTASDMRLFNKWLRCNNEMRLAEEIPVTELDKCLARFFMTVKKDDESNYEPQSVRSMQSSISRYLTEKCAINIMVDKEFHHSRDVMSAKLKQLKSMGMGAKKRKADPFTAEEVNLLYEKELLGAGNPQSLVRTVWMNNTLHFGLRSREEHTTLRWGDIQMKATTDGQQYLEHTERITKTRNGANLDTRAFQAKMFADTGNPRCPIQTYKQFLRRRPEDMVADDCPFYLGFSRQIKDDGVWFSRQALGKNTLSSFVKKMCEDGGIQGRKTNHSVRKTTITALVHEDIPDTRIMQLSGHKNVQSINSYSSASIEQQKEMSNILSKIGTGKITSDKNPRPLDDNNNDIPSDDDAELLSASQEAELSFVLKDISNFESNSKPVSATTTTGINEMPEIVHENHKGKAMHMFAGATITGNVTINFSN
ncbi:unnamed protein product [Mytilus edulis]|uniref:Tyr recombinase domain-containing protein n=1 Tax=Mytilus edulis TaxID=6550 RepID=A0A8S3VNX9_MYTED|nr:unnamed protein product [Mytilus edulis]